MCELTGMILFSLWFLVVLFHKHRFILMRRFFSISGTIFMLRCVTMLITSLSVPGTHLSCQPRPYGDLWNKVHNAYIIWTGNHTKKILEFLTLFCIDFENIILYTYDYLSGLSFFHAQLGNITLIQSSKYMVNVDQEIPMLCKINNINNFRCWYVFTRGPYLR